MAEALQAIKGLVPDSVRSPHTRRAYDRVLMGFSVVVSLRDARLHQSDCATIPS